jgi:hypothetical protein
VASLFSWRARAGEATASTVGTPRITETLATTRALPKFLAALASQPSPVLLDLGPVVGGNVAFFGDRLSCKLVIEDLHEDIEAAWRRGSTAELAAVLTARVRDSVDAPVHGILCWDVFDYLDRPTAAALAACLVDVLRPRGVLHGQFTTLSTDATSRTKFIVESETALKCRAEAATPIRRVGRQIGEITRLFPGFTAVDSVLLQNQTRECLFRKA